MSRSSTLRIFLIGIIAALLNVPAALAGMQGDVSPRSPLPANLVELARAHEVKFSRADDARELIEGRLDRITTLEAKLAGVEAEEVPVEAPEVSAPDDEAIEVMFLENPPVPGEPSAGMLELAWEFASLGAALSVMGRREDSIWAYQEALLANPEESRYWFDIGTELSVLGRDAEAEDAFRTGMMARQPAFDHFGAAAFHFLAKAKYPDVLEVAGRTAGGDTTYMTLYAVMASKAMGGDPEKRLREQGWDANPASDRWPGPLVEFARGAINESQLIEAIVDPRTGKPDADRLCEALYFAGLNLEIQGARGRAIEHYRAAIATGVIDYLQYFGAERGLVRLGASSPVAH